MRKIGAGLVGVAAAAALVIGAAAPAQAGVVLYENTYYGGAWYDFGYGYVPALGSWNDRASSVTVSGTPYADLHEHEYYKGAYLRFSVGTDHLGAYGYGFNDRTSSIF